MTKRLIAKCKDFLQFAFFFSISMTVIYLTELFCLSLKNIINGHPIFDFPIGVIYIGFL